MQNDRKSTLRFIHLSILAILVMLISSASLVYADKYDFSYKLVRPGESYSQNGRRVEVINNMDTMKINIYKNNQLKYSCYSGGRTSFTNGHKVFISLKTTSNKKAKIIYYDFDKSKDYTVAKIKVDNLAECNGKFLFYYKNMDQGGGELWRLNISTKKKKKIDDQVAYIKYSDGRYIFGPESGDSSKTPVYLMKKDGTGKKKICEAIGAGIYKKKVYYKLDYGYKNGKYLVKIYRCDFNGKNKKALTKKIPYDKVPDKYEKIIRSTYS